MVAVSEKAKRNKQEYIVRYARERTRRVHANFHKENDAQILSDIDMLREHGYSIGDIVRAGVDALKKKI